MRSEAIFPVNTRRGLRPWRHGRQRLDHWNLGHGWRQRDRWTWGQRGNRWHGWDGGNERFHGARAWPAPHLIGATEEHCHEQEWHQRESDDHPQGSASHGVCPPCRHEVGVDVLVRSSIRTGLGHVNTTTGVARVHAGCTAAPPSPGHALAHRRLVMLCTRLPMYATGGGRLLGRVQPTSYSPSDMPRAAMYPIPSVVAGRVLWHLTPQRSPTQQ